MTRIAFQGTLAIAFLILGTQFAFSDDSQPITNTNSSIEISESDALKNCAFVTNNCELCSTDGTGKIYCSSVGIACQPTKWDCLKQDLESP